MIRLILIQFIWLSTADQILCQFQGGVGSGLKEVAQNEVQLSGNDFSFLFVGASGRGDQAFGINNFTLDDGDIVFVFIGGSGRGEYVDSEQSFGLNGDRFNALFTGNKGRGDHLTANIGLSLNGEDLGVMYIGENGCGESQTEKINLFLDGGMTEILYTGGSGRGDDQESAPSEIIHCTYYSIWTGTVSTAWENPANWQCGELPHRFSDVLIPTTVPNFPFITVSPVEIRNLTMDNSSMLHVIGVPLNVLGGDQ